MTGAGGGILHSPEKFSLQAGASFGIWDQGSSVVNIVCAGGEGLSAPEYRCEFGPVRVCVLLS